jgi:hypothetical protein
MSPVNRDIHHQQALRDILSAQHPDINANQLKPSIFKNNKKN